MPATTCKRALALRLRSATSAGPTRGWFTRMFNPRQSARGGPPTTTYGLAAPRKRITRSRSSGRSKPHETPPGPGR
eukprot:8248747-Alexandrium_andersonii.AAC.1